MKLHEIFDKPKEMRSGDQKVAESNPKIPAVLDRQHDEPFAELGKRPRQKRQGQRSGRNLKRQYGIGGEPKNAAGIREESNNAVQQWIARGESDNTRMDNGFDIILTIAEYADEEQVQDVAFRLGRIGYKNDKDFEIITAMGDDIPSFVQLNNPKMLSDPKVEKLLRMIEGENAYTDDEEDIDEDIRTDRMVRAMTPPAGAKPSSKLDLSRKKKKRTTKANEAEEGTDIKARDPRVSQMLRVARAKYAGSADDDLSALVSMMGDEQKVQDRELDNLDIYNQDQDVDIDHEENINRSQETELGSLGRRIEKLERDGVKEAISPSQGHDEFPYWDEETGELFTDRQIERGEDGKYRYKEAEPTVQDYGIEDDDDDFDGWLDRTGGQKTISPAVQAQAMGMFGDIAAGGGDPIDHLMTELGLDMDTIDAMAVDQGYTDANEWASSYTEMESLKRNTKHLIGEEAKQNWFETLNAALESEGLTSTWDGITMGGISYGENRSWNAVDDQGQCRHISIYRETDGRYERPVHYPSKMC